MMKAALYIATFSRALWRLRDNRFVGDHRQGLEFGRLLGFPTGRRRGSFRLEQFKSAAIKPAHHHLALAVTVKTAAKPF